jgi:hypothetical protein
LRSRGICLLTNSFLVPLFALERWRIQVYNLEFR